VHCANPKETHIASMNWVISMDPSIGMLTNFRNVTSKVTNIIITVIITMPIALATMLTGFIPL
jgi:hypothetical protein